MQPSRGPGGAAYALQKPARSRQIFSCLAACNAIHRWRAQVWRDGYLAPTNSHAAAVDERKKKRPSWEDGSQVDEHRQRAARHDRRPAPAAPDQTQNGGRIGWSRGACLLESNQNREIRCALARLQRLDARAQCWRRRRSPGASSMADASATTSGAERQRIGLSRRAAEEEMKARACHWSGRHATPRQWGGTSRATAAARARANRRVSATLPMIDSCHSIVLAGRSISLRPPLATANIGADQGAREAWRGSMAANSSAEADEIAN